MFKAGVQNETKNASTPKSRCGGEGTQRLFTLRPGAWDAQLRYFLVLQGVHFPHSLAVRPVALLQCRSVLNLLGMVGTPANYSSPITQNACLPTFMRQSRREARKITGSGFAHKERTKYICY